MSTSSELNVADAVYKDLTYMYIHVSSLTNWICEHALVMIIAVVFQDRQNHSRCSERTVRGLHSTNHCPPPLYHHGL